MSIQRKIKQKERSLQRKVRKGEISESQAEDRLAQSIQSHTGDRRAPPAKFIRQVKPYRESEYAKAYNYYLMCLLDPDLYESHIPDLFSLFPSAIETVVTRFTVSPDANGIIALRVVPRRFAQVGVMLNGTTVIGGTTYTGGGVTPQFPMFKYADRS